MKKLLPGLILVLIISLVSKFISSSIENYVTLESLTVTIIIGMAYRNSIGLKGKFIPGVKFSLKKILKWGIVLLGFKLNLYAILELGPTVLVMVLLYVPIAIALAMLLAKVFKVNIHTATLIGVGSSICGASAIVAMSPIINASEDDTVLSVSIVSLLGAIGVIAYSSIALVTNLGDVGYGIWSGLTLHGVAHALAAAFARGSEAGEIGTFVKMARVMMLVPTSLYLSYHFRDSETNERRNGIKVPGYILLFIAMGILNATNILPDAIVDILAKLSSYFILMAMTSMGLSVDLKSFRNTGLKAILLGSVLFAGLSTVMYVIIQLIF